MLRILRLVRGVHVMRKMSGVGVIIEALNQGMSQTMAVLCTMTVLIYSYSLIGMSLFGQIADDTDPDTYQVRVDTTAPGSAMAERREKEPEVSVSRGDGLRRLGSRALITHPALDQRTLFIRPDACADGSLGSSLLSSLHLSSLLSFSLQP